MNLRLLEPAKLDIAEAANYYETELPGLGDRFTLVVEAALENVRQRPESFSFLETLPPVLGYRRVLVTPFRHLAIYRIRGDEVVVYALVHASRKPNFWLGRKA